MNRSSSSSSRATKARRRLQPIAAPRLRGAALRLIRRQRPDRVHDDAILVHKIANRVYLIVAVGVGHLGDPRDLQPLPAPCEEALPVGALVDDEARLHIRVSERGAAHAHGRPADAPPRPRRQRHCRQRRCAAGRSPASDGSSRKVNIVPIGPNSTVHTARTVIGLHEVQLEEAAGCPFGARRLGRPSGSRSLTAPPDSSSQSTPLDSRRLPRLPLLLLLLPPLVLWPEDCLYRRPDSERERPESE